MFATFHRTSTLRTSLEFLTSSKDSCLLAAPTIEKGKSRYSLSLTLFVLSLDRGSPLLTIERSNKLSTLSSAAKAIDSPIIVEESTYAFQTTVSANIQGFSSRPILTEVTCSTKTTAVTVTKLLKTRIFRTKVSYQVALILTKALTAIQAHLSSSVQRPRILSFSSNN